MADVHEKDYGHTGGFTPNYPTGGSQADDTNRTGGFSKFLPSIPNTCRSQL